MIARNDCAHHELCRQFAERTVSKYYIAIVDGNFKSDKFTVDAPIGRDRRNRLKMAVAPDGRRAVTVAEVLERYKNNCYARFELCTGRTHQIRVHCAYLGHPIACDALYGGSGRLKAAGQLLHSARISFTHPRTKERMNFEAQAPDDFIRGLDILRKESI